MKTLKLKDKMSNDLQTNLKSLYKNYGDKFKIAFKSIKKPLEVIMKINIHDFSKIKYFSLSYDIPNRDYDLYPFLINFVDVVDKKLNDNCYIAHIHKTDDISGSDMITIVLELCRYLNVKTAYIYDGTTVMCKKNEYDLSFIKLLEKNMTFYMKHGFDIMASNNDYFSRYFTSKENKKKYIMDLIKKCKAVKNKDICRFYKELLKYCTNIILNQNYDDMKQYNKNVTEEITWIGKSNIINIITEINDMLGLLNEDEYLYQTMIRIFNDKDKCINFDTLSKYITDNNCYIIEFISRSRIKKFLFDMYDPFKLLQTLRYSYFYINL